MTMDNKIDEVKGNTKEKVGKITDDKQMEGEGIVEKKTAQFKEFVSDTAQKLNEKRKK